MATPVSGQGTKGPRLHDWCYLELADLKAGEFNEKKHGLWTCGLLIRRNIADGDLAYFTTWCPAGTPIDTLVSVEGRRWAIEDSFDLITTKPGLGMAGIGSHACLRHDGGHPASGQQADARKSQPLVDPGDPAHGAPPRAETHRSSRYHRMVTLGACASAAAQYRI